MCACFVLFVLFGLVICCIELCVSVLCCVVLYCVGCGVVLVRLVFGGLNVDVLCYVAMLCNVLFRSFCYSLVRLYLVCCVVLWCYMLVGLGLVGFRLL